LVDVRAILIFLSIVGYSIALFLPLIGHGFILDDFVHLCSVVYDPLWQGLTKATGGPFYAPIAWLSYKLDWMLWGWNPFAFAAINLTLHITNIILLYHLALRLYCSVIAARWSGFGYALLFPANSWAVMWISTRAHLLVTLFYLAALIATLWYLRTERHRVTAIIAVSLFAALSIFSKECGVTVLGAIALLIFKESRTKKYGPSRRLEIIGLFALLFAVLLLYVGVRGHSGAIPITFSGNSGYFYSISPKLLLEHLLRYAWRTFGLLAIMAGAIALSQYLRGHNDHLKSLTRRDVIFSVALFSITIAPYILLPTRSGIYSYLPGIAAALLLGSIARSLSKSPVLQTARANIVTLSPIIIVVIIYSCFMVGHSLRWKKMAGVSAYIMDQIVRQQPKVAPNTLIVLTYNRVENESTFPGSIAWGFPYALRVIYGDQSIDGTIIHQGEPYRKKTQEIHLVYTRGKNENPIITPIDEIGGME